MKKRCMFFLFILIGIVIVGCAEKDNMTDIVDQIQSDANNRIIDDTAFNNETEKEDKNENDKKIENVDLVDYDAKALIPEGWAQISVAEGDLNGDAIDDVVQIIEKKEEDPDNDVRKLQIAFGMGSDKYTIDTETADAILLKIDGGVWGEPLESLSIADGQIIIKFFGGSNYKWYATFRFNYQAGDWYLTSLKQGDYYSADLTQQHCFEYNLTTGAYLFESANSKGEMMPYDGVINDEQPILLEKFNIYETMKETWDRFESYEQEEVEIDLNTMSLMEFLYRNEEWKIQPTLTVRNVTFYRPLTVEEATLLNLDYDGVIAVNDVRYITYDWVEGDDGMDEEEDDSLMTVERYAETFGLRVANIAELTALIEEETTGFLVEDEEINFGWPMIFWTSDKGGDDDGDNNPIQFDMTNFYEGGLEGWDFPPFNLPVILVSGDLYNPDYTGTRAIKEKVINDDGTGYIEVRLYDKTNEKEGWVTIKLNQDTKIYLIDGSLGSMEDLTSSQEGMDVIMDDNRDYAKEIYLTPFDAF